MAEKEKIYGRRVWSLLHTMAAYYPQTPSEDDKQRARDFITIFFADAIEYPDWSKHVDTSSFRPDSNRDFREWVCVQHNRVNQHLGKPQHSCAYEDLYTRWGGPSE